MGATTPAEGQQARRIVLLGFYAPSLINFRGPLIAALIERGHEVFALARDIDARIAGQIEAIGGKAVSVPLGRTSLHPLNALRTTRELHALLENIRPDVLIAYTIKPVVLGAAAARAAHIPRFIPMITGLGYAFLGGLHPKHLLIRLAAIWMYRRALAACGIYVLPSYREGTSRSVLEAMAVGRAVITTDVPGCRETAAEGENGFLVPPRDADALYRAMRRFVETPELCQIMGAASRRIAEERFDLRKVNQAILHHAAL